MKKIFRFDLIHDQFGSRYPGVKVSEEVVQPYLVHLRNMVGEKKYLKLTGNQKKRDGDEYHITLLTHREFDQGEYEAIEKYREEELSFKFIGLGRANKGRDESYYVVVKCSDADEIRNALRLPKQDFHITLGFQSQDVHGVAKDESTLVEA